MIYTEARIVLAKLKTIGKKNSNETNTSPIYTFID